MLIIRIWEKVSVILGVILTYGFLLEGACAEEIIADDFSTSSTVTESGQAFAPSFSKAGTTWLVESGRVSSNGTPLPYETPSGQLVLDRSQKTKVKIDFGNVAADTAAKISFQLRNWDGAGASTAFFFNMTIGCKQLGMGYSVLMSLSPNYYGTKNGTSGIGIIDSGGAHGGVADAHFPVNAEGQNFHDVTIEFDPENGVSVFLDGELVAAHGNTGGLPKVDYLTLGNEGKEKGGNLSWLVDNFSVEASLEP